jgi:hypothetical protein
MALAHAHILAPSPGMFFALGVLATLCLLGIAFGIREGLRSAHTGTRIGDCAPVSLARAQISVHQNRRQAE